MLSVTELKSMKTTALLESYPFVEDFLSNNHVDLKGYENMTLGDALNNILDEETKEDLGIDADHRERIFAVFQRLHTREEYPGTGIGLAIVKELVDKGREAKVTLIIDNLQSGKDAGAAIAEELDCERVILSNFPGGFDNTETWEKAIDRNVELILEAIAR